MRDIEKQNKVFFGKIAKYYDFIFGNWIRKMQIKVIESAKIKNKSRVLDAGCGTGNFLSLVEKRNIELYGIDISKEMLKIARRKLKKTKIKLASVESRCFNGNYFDYIFSIDAFHHYSDKEKAIRNFHRMLRGNGKLIIVDLSFGRFLNKIFQKLEPGNSGILSKQEIKNILKGYEFRKIEQSRAGLFTTMTIGIK